MAKEKEKKITATLGQIVKVKNKDKKTTENDSYIAIQVANEEGKEKRCVLFTEKELNAMKKIKSNFLELSLKAGRLYKVIANSKMFNIIKLKTSLDDEIILKMPNSYLKRAEARALKNKEDLTKRKIF